MPKVASIDRRVIGYQALAPEHFTDDRFRRALDRLYQADRASLMTEVVVAFSRTFDLDLSFLYVADSKACTDEQPHYIVQHGGRAITIVPESWAEVAAFKRRLRTARCPKRENWRRPRPEAEHEVEHVTNKRDYRIHWIYLSEKRKRDRLAREKRLSKAEQALLELNTSVSEFIVIEVNTTHEIYQVQLSKGRPGKNTRYEDRERSIYTLSWRRHDSALKAEARVDGLFPLLSTDISLSAKTVLQAYMTKRHGPGT